MSSSDSDPTTMTNLPNNNRKRKKPRRSRRIKNDEDLWETSSEAGVFDDAEEEDSRKRPSVATSTGRTPKVARTTTTPLSFLPEVTPLTNRSKDDQEEDDEEKELRPVSFNFGKTRKPSVPEGVLDLYPKQRNHKCFCDDDHCNANSLTHSYLNCYGQHYYQHLKEWEGECSSKKLSAASTPSPSAPMEDLKSTPPSRVQYLRPKKQQDVFSVDSDSSSPSRSLADQPHITNRMRAVLVDWMVEVSMEYKLSQTTIHLAVELVNQSLKCGSNKSSVVSSPGSEGSGSSREFIVERDMLQCLGW